MSKYTTGEVAKLCDVSVRTVQFYDDKGLLSPSELTEGGRRLYSEEDVSQLKVICYLRSLSIGIKTIKQMFDADNSQKVIKCLLEEHEKQLKADIDEKQKALEAVQNINRSLKSNDEFFIQSISDIAHDMENNKKLKKVYATAFITGIPLALYQIFSIVFWIVTGTWWPFVVWAVIAIPYSIIISKYYWSKVAYICPECKHVFKAKFKEGFFANHTPKTRKLTCPRCGKKSFCIETSIDDLEN
ncbi:MAG: MerR family transcriptional regulator [Clostridia bacterium]|nr:MerR family transcriptional regulator [Clostridia bacterium]